MGSLRKPLFELTSVILFYCRLSLLLGNLFNLNSGFLPFSRVEKHYLASVNQRASYRTFKCFTCKLICVFISLHHPQVIDLLRCVRVLFNRQHPLSYRDPCRVLSSVKEVSCLRPRVGCERVPFNLRVTSPLLPQLWTATW